LKIEYTKRKVFILKNVINTMVEEYAYLEFNNGTGIPIIKGTRIRASVLGIDYKSWGYDSPEDLARDRGISIAAVKESISWCEKNDELVTRVCAEERSRAGLKD